MRLLRVRLLRAAVRQFIVAAGALGPEPAAGIEEIVLDHEEHGDEIPEREELKFSVKVSGLSV